MEMNVISPVIQRNKLAKKAAIVIKSLLVGSTVEIMASQTVNDVRVPAKSENSECLISFIFDLV